MLPEGGILVFVTGQQEVHTLCRKLRQMYPMDGKRGKSHRILPEGGIVFVTINSLCRKLRQLYSMDGKPGMSHTFVEYSRREVFLCL